MPPMLDIKAIKPPHVPFDSWQRFLAWFRRTRPEKITRSTLRPFGDTARTQLVQALRFMKYIDDDGMPKPALFHLVSGSTRLRGEILRQHLQITYAEIFGDDLAAFWASATKQQVADCLERTGLRGENLRKAATFAWKIAEQAGYEVSRAITSLQRRTEAPPLQAELSWAPAAETDVVGGTAQVPMPASAAFGGSSDNVQELLNRVRAIKRTIPKGALQNRAIRLAVVEAEEKQRQTRPIRLRTRR